MHKLPSCRCDRFYEHDNKKKATTQQSCSIDYTEEWDRESWEATNQSITSYILQRCKCVLMLVKQKQNVRKTLQTLLEIWRLNKKLSVYPESSFFCPVWDVTYWDSASQKFVMSVNPSFHRCASTGWPSASGTTWTGQRSATTSPPVCWWAPTTRCICASPSSNTCSQRSCSTLSPRSCRSSSRWDVRRFD